MLIRVPILKRTEQSDFIKYSICNLQSLLLLDVGHTNRSRWGGTSNGTGQNEDGEYIRDHIDKLRRHHLRQIRLEGFAESEQHSGTGGAKGRPLAEDHGSQADEAPTGTDAFDKIVCVFQG